MGDATAGKSKEIKRDEFLATKHSISALLAAKVAVSTIFTAHWGGDAFFLENFAYASLELVVSRSQTARFNYRRAPLPTSFVKTVLFFCLR